MAFGFRLSEVVFSGGQSVVVPAVGTTLVVGPNNSGKSRALREIFSRLRRNEPRVEAVVSMVVEERSGTPDEFLTWMSERFRVTANRAVGAGFDVSTTDVAQLLKDEWTQSPAFAYASLALVSHLDTASRLSAADPSGSYDAVEEHPIHPLQIVYADPQAESRLSQVFSEAFDDSVVVDRHSAKTIPLRTGARPDPAKFGGQLSLGYAAEVRKLPLLHQQGDGMRSFVACLLQTEVLQRPVALIDEPEAFLHPPQARQLAFHLARSAADQKRQIIIATHSADIVQGVLESASPAIVVRVERVANKNNAWQLRPDKIADLWKDPLFRVSNILDGLFHRAVVLCEADADCRFYRTILEIICRVDNVRMPEVMFTYTGGKDRLAIAVRALRAVKVPVIPVADLDVLSEEYPLREIWEALGHEWSAIVTDWKIVKAAVDQTARNPGIAFVKDEIAKAFDETTGSVLDKKTSDRIRAATRAEGGWAYVKRSGLEAIPKGDARAACQRLLATLSAGGMHVVPVGELEGFVPDVGLHGPRWLEKALSRDLETDATAAIAFVRGIITSSQHAG